jgi:hypothetical protein
MSLFSGHVARITIASASIMQHRPMDDLFTNRSDEGDFVENALARWGPNCEVLIASAFFSNTNVGSYAASTRSEPNLVWPARARIRGSSWAIVSETRPNTSMPRIRPT